MALSQSALNELLEAIRAGDGTDTLREAMRLVLQELIEAEATRFRASGTQGGEGGLLMKKKVLGLVAASAFAIAAVGAPVAAAPNEDSAAGNCDVFGSPGIGQEQQLLVQLPAKALRDVLEAITGENVPLGQVKKYFDLNAGQIISEYCAPGKPEA